jgi:hypothetical protein
MILEVKWGKLVSLSRSAGRDKAMDHARKTNADYSDPNHCRNSCFCSSLLISTFSMLPTVLPCFSTFSSNSLCHSLCRREAKKPGFHRAILLIRDSWAMGAGHLNGESGTGYLQVGRRRDIPEFSSLICQTGAAAPVHVDRVIVDGPT